MEHKRQIPLRLLQLQKVYHHEVTGSVSNFYCAMKFGYKELGYYELIQSQMSIYYTI